MSASTSDALPPSFFLCVLLWASASRSLCHVASSADTPRYFGLTRGVGSEREVSGLSRSDQDADLAKARSTRSRTTPGRYRSAHNQRTICHPRSRSASCRTFSAKITSSSDVSGLQQSIRYLILPSNSPIVRCSFQQKGRHGRQTSHARQVDTLCCGSGGGAIRLREGVPGLTDSPGLSLRGSKSAMARLACRIPGQRLISASCASRAARTRPYASARSPASHCLLELGQYDKDRAP